MLQSSSESRLDIKRRGIRILLKINFESFIWVNIVKVHMMAGMLKNYNRI